MATLENTRCCGIGELHRVESSRSAKDKVLDAAEAWFEDDAKGAFIFFSVTASYKRKGTELAAYIKKHNLGTVHKTRPTINSSTSNILTMYVWTVNKKTLQAFWEKNKEARGYYDNDDNADYY